MQASDVLIVGAGQAAGRCAEALRAAGYAGSVTIVGDESWPPYERPPLSKEFLAGAVQVEKLFTRPPEWYAENAVTVRSNTRVAQLDRGRKMAMLEDGESIAYGIAVLATGSRPRQLTIPGATLPGVCYLRSLDDSIALRRRLVSGGSIAIIGGGLIGLEVAACAADIGCAVQVIEQSALPMERVVGADIGQLYADLHRARGITLHLRTAVESIHGHAQKLRLTLDDRTTVDVDAVVVGIGVVPNMELAAECGLDVANGIEVDEYGTTSDPSLYAIGDCASFHHPALGRRLRLETWRHAQNHAVAVARNIAGNRAPYTDVPWGWSTQFGITLQVAGAPTQWDRTVWRGDPATHRAIAFRLRDDIIVAAHGMNMPREIRAAQKLIASAARIDASLLAMPEVKLEETVVVETGRLS